MAFVELVDREGAAEAPKKEKPKAKAPAKKAAPKAKTKVADKAPVAALGAFDADAAKAALGKKIKQDDLTMVEGIGPKIAGIFNDAGITTWAELGNTDVERLKELLAAAGDRYKMHDPETWPRQAKLAADGQWEELAKWQDELDGGRVVE